MKTHVLKTIFWNCLLLIVAGLFLGISVNAQTFTTIKNGNWSDASTWENGNIPPANGKFTAGMVINIKKRVTYTGADITNEGIINISNTDKASPRLVVASGVNIINKQGGQIIIADAELRQYRFVNSKQWGLTQTGSFDNDGGRVDIRNSYVEIAEDWKNENNGKVYFKNSSLAIGKNYDLKSNAVDSLLYTSVSVGFHGTGDFTVNSAGAIAYYNNLRVQVASITGKFYLQSGTVNGIIDYITLKNNFTNLMSTDKIKANSTIVTSGIVLNSYCVATPLCFEPNGKFTGTQSLSYSLNYFPAKLIASASSASMNMTDAPTLVSGTDLQMGAKYQYESIAPGIDAFVTIDSLVNGATILNLDDNAAGSGFTEGFQPQITSGAFIGNSYVKLKFEYFVAGTTEPAEIADLTLTALDIDGTPEYKEFDEIDLGPGATAASVLANPTITLTQTGPGAFRGINADGLTVNGVDTVSKNNMFTVHNTNVSAFTVKMGLYNTQAIPTLRLFSFYAKGFVYPYMASLPVKMESFTATLNKNGIMVDLNWVTASEINLSHFVIERSTDGINYSDAGVVFANGNSSNRSTYQLTDNISTVRTALVYYRLRSVDTDGNGKYSETRIIRLSKQQDQGISILTYPNPVTNELRITVPAGWQNKPSVFEIYSANGQVMNRMERASTSQTETINVSNLVPAFYIVLVKCNGEVAQQKIIKR